MNITTILTILFAHWVADFVCQTDKMAQGKSKNWGDLLTHTNTYSIVITLFVAVAYLFEVIGTPDIDYWFSVKFMLITFVCHTITDYFTSRLNSKLWADKKVHWFFVSIGFDQWLHYVQLFLTYQLLAN